MPLLSDRQTILLIADPHVIAQLRIVLNDSHARQARGAELPTGQLLRYDFDRNLHP
jgi:bisphosphoglycerate-dependent phosphoglycerate mutase